MTQGEEDVVQCLACLFALRQDEASAFFPSQGGQPQSLFFRCQQVLLADADDLTFEVFADGFAVFEDQRVVGFDGFDFRNDVAVEAFPEGRT